MLPRVFIDGEAGTTGLQIFQRLSDRRDLRVVSIDPERRKDPQARKAMLNEADAVILCLPDEAAREAVSLIDNPAVRVIDASTAHRTAADWTYGMPELRAGQRQAIAAATRISNPGCWPTGFLALVRPLVAEGLVPSDWPLSVHGVSGYSGGGKSMIAEFEDKDAPGYTQTPFRPYGTSLEHKHIPEMMAHAGLSRRPVFCPAVGRYRQGMIVEVPLSLEAMPARPRPADLQAALEAAYAGERFVQVATTVEAAATGHLDPQAMNGGNGLKLYVFGDTRGTQARLVAVLDNLGKGASGAAVQNLNLALGLEESAGL